MNNIFNIPRHIAIIMDGNGRWAEKNNKKRIFGHEKGANVAFDIVKISNKLKIKYLTLYAFSTENRKRPKFEILFIFKLLIKYINLEIDNLKKNNIKLKFLGEKEELPNNIKKKIIEAENKTINCDGLYFNIAFNYGGRQEIINSFKKIINYYKKNNLDINKILNKNKIIEKLIENNLYTKGIPDPDLIIRTSGEIRTSNFFLWQSAYSEYYFTNVLWPDFNKTEFIKAIKAYNNRIRRFGDV